MKLFYIRQSLLLAAAMTLIGTFDMKASTTEEGVDLGLSVIWSTQLVEGYTTTDYTKDFVWASPFCRVDYNNSGEYAPSDFNVGLNISATNYDPAAVIWGDGWRLPTKAEVEELIALGVKSYSENGYVVGYQINGKNGNSLTLKDIHGSRRVRFWTATAYRDENDETDCSKAWACEFTLGKKGLVYADRTTYYSILPVRDKAGTPAVPVTEVKLSDDHVILTLGEEATIYPFVMPENATLRRVSYKSSDESVVSVDEFGRLKPVTDGTVTITATAADGSGCTATCDVKIKKISEDEEVDMGLSVLWSTHNVGATSIVDPGTHFMFATPQIVQKFSATASPYANTCVIPVEDMAGTEYDPATVHMGNGWMTPTKEQMQELFDNCKKTDVDGGFELTSNINGAKIFLPASGNRYVNATNDKYSAYLMTSKTNSTDLVSGTYPCGKVSTLFLPSFTDMTNTKGTVIRPVKPKGGSALPSIAEDDFAGPLDVYNLQGMRVAQLNDGSSLKSVLPPGIYIIRTNSGKVLKIKI